MNFIDAAVEILAGQPGKPLHVEELCQLAIDRELLTRPGKTPLRSMKTRLTTELKKGDESRVLKVGDDLWQLRGEAEEAEVAADSDEPTEAAEAAEAEDAAEAAEAAPGEPADEAEAAAAEEGGEIRGRRRRRRRRRRGGSAAGGEREEAASDPSLAAVVVPEPRGGLEDLLAPDQRSRRGEEAVVPEADEAEELYAGELEPAPPDAGTAEYRDHQTDDEDRPMLPEISARKERFKQMREKRRDDRDQRRRRRRGGRSDSGGDEARGNGQPRVDTVALLAEVLDGAPRYLAPGNEWGDGAAQALAAVSGGQATQVKQLAQMMRKRGALSGDPVQQAPLVKVTLLQHIRERAAAGLAPDIEYRGRDLFAAAAVDDGPTAASAAALAEALVQHKKAVRAAMADRLSTMPLDGLQQLVHLYLIDLGWSDISWIKRVDQSYYATAQPLADAGQILLGVRAGRKAGDAVDRRGIGELRAGVGAKGLRAGWLLSPLSLSAEATEELDKAGAPVHVLCADAFVDALIRAEIGVVRQPIEVTRLDLDLLGELSRS